MKSQIYRNIILSSLSYIIITSLVLSVLTKPVFTFLLQMTDVSYEFVDDFEKNESTNKEAKSELEQEEQSIFYIYFNEIELNSEHIKGYNNSQRSILNFNPNIHLPPPKI